MIKLAIRCKFVCTKKEESDRCASILMVPVYSGSEENKKFFESTPSGGIELGVVNPEAAKQLEEGKEYYIDITPAE